MLFLSKAIGKIPINVEELRVDYLTIVGHKFYAPKIGALYVRDLKESDKINVKEYVESPQKELFSHEKILPIFFGGGQERGWRSGTENTPMIVGLGEAAKLVNSNLESYSRNMRQCRDYFEDLLSTLLGERAVVFNGKNSQSQRLPNTSNFSIVEKGKGGKALLSKIRTFRASLGAACHSDKTNSASQILIDMNIPYDIAINAIRVSFGRDTTKDQVKRAAEEIERILQVA